jgi:PAS domain S-box-containing protein
LTVSPVRDSHGTIIGASKIVRDITESKHAGRMMAQVENLLALIVASSDDAIISKDLSGTVTSWNRGAERMFGYTAKEMIGSSLLHIIPPERHSEEAAILSKLRAKKGRSSSRRFHHRFSADRSRRQHQRRFQDCP